MEIFHVENIWEKWICVSFSLKVTQLYEKEIKTCAQSLLCIPYTPSKMSLIIFVNHPQSYTHPPSTYMYVTSVLRDVFKRGFTLKRKVCGPKKFSWCVRTKVALKVSPDCEMANCSRGVELTEIWYEITTDAKLLELLRS